ncbi:MAG: DNA-directed RNA polymerase subunit omega [Candidatus Omnitrophota bacterium]
MQAAPIDKLYDKAGSTYKLVIMASRRAVELNEGAGKLVDATPDMKPGAIALKEILEGKISFKIKEEK